MDIKKFINQSNVVEMLNKSKEQLESAIKKYNNCIKSNDITKAQINSEYIKKLQLNLDLYLDRINKILTDQNFNNYNVQYINFVENQLYNVINALKNINNNNFLYNDSNIIYNLIAVLNNYMINNNLLTIYDQFKDGNSNYILFGKNGAGKTSLLKQLNNNLLRDNTIVVPATRNINYRNNTYHCKDEVNLVTAINSFEDGKTIFLLNECIKAESYLQLKNGKEEETVLSNIATKIFNNLGLDRCIDIDHKDGIKLYNSFEEYYSFSNASDGEKSAVYFIFVTLLSPINSYLFIDEPENHLNGSLMKKLFDMLENYRKDIKFVYATHNTDFIQSRNNVKLVYLDKGQKINEWKCRKIDDEMLPLDLILSVEGTNQDVLFCEGENTSFDLRIYSILFPEYKITPISGCDNVISHTKMVNEYATVFKKNACGIVDNDFKSEEKILQLKNEKIYTLSVNEIENIFLIEECLEKAINKIGASKTMAEITNKLFETAEHQKDAILIDYSTKLLRTLHLKNKVKNIINIADEIDSLNEKNKTEFLKLFESFKSSLEDVIAEKKYYDLLRIVPGKILLHSVYSFIGYSDKNLFCNNILNDIDDRLKIIILQKIGISL